VGQRTLLVAGQGHWVWDRDGHCYLDAVASALNSSCGYGHKALVDAATEQMTRLPHVDLSVATHAPAELFAARLAELLPGDLDRVLFLNSGSEAAEAALRMALGYWRNVGEPRTRVVTFARGYHGSTALALHLSGLPAMGTAFAPPFPVTRVELPFPPAQAHAPGAAEALLDSFARAIGGSADVAAVVVEPLLNVGGGVVLPPGFLHGLRELCHRTGALLVADEVFCGFGRTGRSFGFDHDRITPDIVLLSKGITSGYVPLAATVARRHVHDSFAADPVLGGLRYGHTTSGHAVACAVGLATLDVIENQELVSNADRMGTFLLQLLKPLARYPSVLDVRGLGLVAVVEMATADQARRVVDRAREFRLLLRCQQNAVMAVPPLTIDRSGIEELADRCTRAVDSLGLGPVEWGPVELGPVGLGHQRGERS
jgi:adenosylmethionine-8-amino-7-oxononanoate aminotransferase/4-aminobutyrate--pyruvate transaminase